MAATAWKPQRLDELGFVGRGKSRHRPRNDERLYGGRYPFIQTADIMAADPYITTYSQTYSDFGFQQSKMWPTDTLCMTIAGANTAKTAILKIEACFPDSVVGFVPDKRKADLYFVKYALDLMKHRFLAVSRGATQDNLSLDKLLSFPILAPGVELQRRIGAVFAAYDDLIENNTRRIQILERMAQALYREWFVNFRFPGHEKVKLVDSPVGKIPQGWKPGSLGDIAGEVRRGVNPEQVDPDTPYIGLEHMPRKSIALLEWGTAKEIQSTKLLFRKGEILFGKIRPYFHKVGVAAVDGVCSTDAIVIVPKSPEYFALVLGCVSSEDFVNHATQTSQGTKMPRANWDVLMKYPLPLPPPSLLTPFNESTAETIALIQNLLFKNRNLRRTRDLLLPKLISGALDTSNLNIELT